MSIGVRSALSALSRDTRVHEHAGLMLDRYVTALGSDNEEEKNARRVLAQAAARMGPPEGYEKAFARRLEALAVMTPNFADGVVRLFEATALGRIITGIGRASVTEMSIALLHTWGVPYLPGTGLKGLAAQAARSRAKARDPGWDENGGAKYRALFGAGGDNKASGGVVTFFDAWWEPGSAETPLATDVMTVHHGPYYSASDRGAVPAPSGQNEPNPVPFLTARGRFVFALAGPPAWLASAAQLLEVALSDFGLGAKTAAGYGRMSLAPRESAAEADARQVREAATRAFVSLPDSFRARVDGGTAKQALQRLLAELDKGCPTEVLDAAGANLAKATKPGFEWKTYRRDKLRDEKDARLAALVDRYILKKP